MSAQKLSLGFIPLIILIAVGIIIAGAGGAYIVRNQFVKTGKSGKAALDEKKIQQQIENPTSLPTLTPTPTSELAPQSYTYQPPVNQGQTANEPGFTIKPPAGWNQVSSQPTSGGFLFEGPTKDKTEGEDGLVVSASPTITIQISKVPSAGNLDNLGQYLKEKAEADYEKVTFISETATTFANQEARFFESILFKQGVGIHSIDYALIKNGYALIVTGAALDSAWDKHEAIIKTSLNTFAFTE